MIATLTRQELQGALDSAKNRIIERQLSRNDAQLMINNLNDSIVHMITSLHYENQELHRFTAKQMEEIRRRLDAIESTMISLDKDVKGV